MRWARLTTVGVAPLPAGQSPKARWGADATRTPQASRLRASMAAAQLAGLMAALRLAGHTAVADASDTPAASRSKASMALRLAGLTMVVSVPSTRGGRRVTAALRVLRGRRWARVPGRRVRPGVGCRRGGDACGAPRRRRRLVGCVGHHG